MISAALSVSISIWEAFVKARMYEAVEKTGVDGLLIVVALLITMEDEPCFQTNDPTKIDIPFFP